jgi:hypothetical protein
VQVGNLLNHNAASSFESCKLTAQAAAGVLLHAAPLALLLLLLPSAVALPPLLLLPLLLLPWLALPALLLLPLLLLWLPLFCGALGGRSATPAG